jgi:hemolysin activation/secretion protein
MVDASTAAVAQVIPPSELPGRERERFTTYPVTPFQPGAPIAGLPSATPPPGTSDIKIIIRAVRIVGSTVYRPEELAQLYAEFIGRTVPLTAVYEIAKRITDKYGADGYVLSRAIIRRGTSIQRARSCACRWSRANVDRVEMPPVLAQYRDFFRVRGEDHCRAPANLFTIERYLLLAGDLPGLRLRNRLVPSATRGAATLVVGVVEKSLSTCWRAPTISAAERAGLSIPGQREHQECPAHP